jgi:uncharacterized protein YndB with AHSA1/START domain
MPPTVMREFVQPVRFAQILTLMSLTLPEGMRMDGTQPIRKAVTIQTDPERAFELFTNEMGTWWPLDSYSRAVNEFQHEDVEVAELVFQARMGGSILERMTDGRVLPWAEVIAWQPPQRVVLSWRPHSLPEPPTEIEVTFAARAGVTRVEVEHRGWERLSDEFRASLYEIYARGWPFTLRCFAEAGRGVASR